MITIALIKTTFASWTQHDAPRLGAALAFYTILSLSPMIILVVALTGLIFSQSTAQAHILGDVRALIGPEGGKTIELMLANTQRPAAGLLGSLLGLASLLFGASGVFTELRAALNMIWDVRPSQTSSGLIGILRERVFSIGMVLSIGFLLMASLVLSVALAAVGKFFGGLLPVPSIVLAGLNFLISFGGVAILFALIFKFVPASEVRWKDVWPGGLLTATLFTIGKTLIGLYLGKSSVGSPYGAAGSVIVMVVWVYYSAQIFFFGAEFTHARASELSTTNTAAQNLAQRKTAA